MVKPARPLTVNQLHKRLGKLIEEGQGRRYVAVSKPSFSSNLEADGHVILDVYSLQLETVHAMDEDGGTKENKDGTEHYLTRAILYGWE